MPGGSDGVVRVARPDAGDDRRAGRRRAVLHARRPGRRRALREDGAQRHRVRRHAADRRGVRPAPARRRALAPARDRGHLPRLEHRATWSRSSSRSPPRCSRTPTRATGKPFVDVVLDQAEQKGTGRWTVQIALDLACRSAASPRRCSPGRCPGTPSSGRRPAALPGPDRGTAVGGRGRLRRRRPSRRCTRRRSSRTRRASTRSRPAATEYGWDIDLGAMATIWRGGCIIRARFLDRIKRGVRPRPGPADAAGRTTTSRDAVGDGQDGVAAGGGDRGPDRASRRPASPRRWPTTTGCARERLPAALIQGQRDFFGAHTYRRVDRDGPSTPCGAATAPRSPASDGSPRRMTALAASLACGGRHSRAGG